jgi:hypothetical protein
MLSGPAPGLHVYDAVVPSTTYYHSVLTLECPPAFSDQLRLGQPRLLGAGCKQAVPNPILIVALSCTPYTPTLKRLSEHLLNYHPIMA